MVKDQARLYNNFASFNGKCLVCSKTSHLLNFCPVINYIPDADFIWKKNNFSTNQPRDVLPAPRKFKRFNVLNNLRSIQNKAVKVLEKNEDISYSEVSSNDENDHPGPSPSYLKSPFQMSSQKVFEYPTAPNKSQKSILAESSRPVSSTNEENSIQVQLNQSLIRLKFIFLRKSRETRNLPYISQKFPKEEVNNYQCHKLFNPCFSIIILSVDIISMCITQGITLRTCYNKWRPSKGRRNRFLGLLQLGHRNF